MLHATLGGLIKDYRLQKGISQLDIAFALGWKEPSRLSRIEQGKTTKPPRDLLDNILQALGLQEDEKNTILRNAGYLPIEEEIRKIRKETDKILEQWAYPASVVDFSWRIISENKHNAELYNIRPDAEKSISTTQPRILDRLFSSAPKTTKSGEQWRSMQRLALARFQYEQRYQTKEKWYSDHIKNLMKNDLFREMWVEKDREDVSKQEFVQLADLRFASPQDDKKHLHFFLFAVPVSSDPRFAIEIFVPQDLETYTYYQ